MIITCIAVRMKSQRLPNKAVADLHGKPMLERLIERVSKAEIPDRVIVCTSSHPNDDILETIANEMGVGCLRGSKLDVMSRFLSAAHITGAEHIVRVTGDNPLTDPYYMDEMIVHHLKKKNDYTGCMDMPKGTRGEVIKVSSLEKLYERIDPDKSEYMTYQLQEMPHTNYYVSGLARHDVRLTVDYPDDLALLQELYKQSDGVPPSLDAIIEWYDGQQDAVQAKRP